MSIKKRSSKSTIDDVARLAGVSSSTVSRVINQSAPVNEETAELVRAAINELDYRPHAAARGLATGKMNALGLLTPNISSPFFIPLLQGIENAAWESGFDLLIHSTQNRSISTLAPKRLLGSHNTDGLLVFAGSLDDSELANLSAINLPIILLLQSTPQSLNIPSVTFENKSSARMLTEHLIKEHACQHIAFIGGSAIMQDSYLREMGFRDALNAHGLKLNPFLIAKCGLKGSGARQIVEKWLEESIPIDAIFAWDDETALEVILALQRAGRRVPEDIAVVGFDDIHLAHYPAPPLTTVRVPVEEVGREGVCQLIRLIQTGDADPVTILPTEVVIRKSCGCN